MPIHGNLIENSNSTDKWPNFFLPESFNLCHVAYVSHGSKISLMHKLYFYFCFKFKKKDVQIQDTVS